MAAGGDERRHHPGGYLGARVARRIPVPWLLALIAAIGWHDGAVLLAAHLTPHQPERNPMSDIKRIETGPA